MAKRQSLSQALEPTPEEAPVPPLASVPAEDAPQKQRRPGREGHRVVSGWFPIAMTLELEELRLDRSRSLGRKITLQELQGEAYNDLFKKYNKAELAPRRAEEGA